MLDKKKTKVIVIGLPKTGTSTLTVMFRMLGYAVTGPDIHFQPNDDNYLTNTFEEYDAFQDYPWCFEWETFLHHPEVKYIVLKRDKEKWCNSFIESYGGDEVNYLSYPYMRLNKRTDKPEVFYEYYEAFYSNVESVAKTCPERFLNVNIETFSWQDLCNFLDEPLPTDIFDRVVKIPHVNKKNKQSRKAFSYFFLKKMKFFALRILGHKKYTYISVFLRKNRLVD